MARPADAAVGKQLANLAAGNRLPAKPKLGINVDVKSHFPPELSQQSNVALRPVAKAEVVTFVNFASLQALLQDFLSELARGHQREIAGERKQQQRVQSGRFEQSNLFRRWRQQSEIRIRAEDARRMRLEADGHRSHLPLFGETNDLLQHA